MTQDDSRTAMRENLQSIVDEASQLPAHEGFRQKTGEDPQPMMQGNPQLLAKIEHALPRLVALLQEERGEAPIVPDNSQGQWDVFRALVNVRAPAPASAEFLSLQDAFLQDLLAYRGIVRLEDLAAADGVSLETSGANGVGLEGSKAGRAGAKGAGVEKADAEDAIAGEASAGWLQGIYLWRGDITRLAADCIVNAANSQMLGCFVPGHHCIDNAIHTFAGVQLRLECARLMKAQGYPEPTGMAKLTGAFNLPSRFIAHTVGPIANGRASAIDAALLANCYTACLEAAADAGCSSFAFCCISTGVFGFPQREAAKIAVNTVADWRARTGASLAVVFNVFHETDEALYRELLR